LPKLPPPLRRLVRKNGPKEKLKIKLTMLYFLMKPVIKD
jgi:hypothetical protein